MAQPFRVPTPPRLSPFAAVLVAAALPLLAFALEWRFRDVFERLPFAPLFLAVALAAWSGGLVPGLLAEALSAALGYAFLHSSDNSTHVAGAAVGAVAFLPFATVIASIGAAARAGFVERERTAETLRASEERERAHAAELQAIMDAVPAVVLIAKDPDARVVTGSRAAFDLLRVRRGDNPSKTGDRPPTHFRVLQDGREVPSNELPTQVAAKRGEALRDVEMEIAFDDGTRCRLLGNAEPLFDQAGRPRGSVSAFVDVTKLSDALRARDAFLSMASHELKTPLTSLQLHVHSLLRRRDRAEGAVERSAAAIQRQAVRLTALVNALLDVSQLNERRLQLSRERVDLAALSHDVASRLTAEAELAGSQVTVQAAGEVAGWWDRLRVEQVVTNLLSNAIKYGCGRPIAIEVEADGATARLAMHDQGIGIGAEEQRRIFERFERGGAAIGYGGLGLGLWIAREFVDAHGGRLSVESRGPGTGATFRVELPLGEPPAGAEASDRPAALPRAP